VIIDIEIYELAKLFDRNIDDDEGSKNKAAFCLILKTRYFASSL
jgi:hypothetical protein